MTDQSIATILADLYDDAEAAELQAAINALIAKYQPYITVPGRDEPFSQRDVVLITYGDTLSDADGTPLQSLHTFAADHLRGAVSTIHLLPFFPYSSDDGFSVMDFYAVNPAVGTWEDVNAPRGDFDLMFDAVFNHMSAGSGWFRRWLLNDPEFAGLFMTESPETDLSGVTRPRATPLLTPFTRPDGSTVHAWTTFSADQVDFDARHPDTVRRLLDVLLFYVAQGATIIRLDAIAYLWKIAGTSSIHLPQTHAVIQLMRAVLDAIAPHVLLITETNVPHAENVSYFGDGYNEAQMVYNFTLPPLLFYTLHTGDASKFRAWVASLDTPSDRTTFFNFTASHDGVGVRPVEGILTADELAPLIDHVKSTGGRVNYKQNTDGTQSPYELNITYVDAIAGTDAPPAVQIARFLLSQTIAMSLAGVPAVYIHSLLGSRNDLEGMARTGHNRTINRAKLDRATIETALNDADSFRAGIFHEYLRRLRLRVAQPAFHPNAAQTVPGDLPPGVFALQRTSADQTVIAAFNVTGEPQAVDLSAHIDGTAHDLLSDSPIEAAFTLAAYQSVWLVVSG